MYLHELFKNDLGDIKRAVGIDFHDCSEGIERKVLSWAQKVTCCV
jgi:hypothetical protein